MRQFVCRCLFYMITFLTIENEEMQISTMDIFSLTKMIEDQQRKVHGHDSFYQNIKKNSNFTLKTSNFINFG